MNPHSLIAEIKQKILLAYPGAEVFLFGSFARGDNRPGSDLDLLILLNKERYSYNDQKAITTLLYNLELDYHQVITPLVRTKKEWYSKYINTPLFINIKNEGVRV